MLIFTLPKVWNAISVCKSAKSTLWCKYKYCKCRPFAQTAVKSQNQIFPISRCWSQIFEIPTVEWEIWRKINLIESSCERQTPHYDRGSNALDFLSDHTQTNPWVSFITGGPFMRVECPIHFLLPCVHMKRLRLHSVGYIVGCYCCIYFYIQKLPIGCRPFTEFLCCVSSMVGKDRTFFHSSTCSYKLTLSWPVTTLKF